MRVYILLFNARTENEGIHTISMGDRNRVLMFESADDAERYALLLEAQDFPTPTVEPIDREDVEEFCREAGYDCELVEEGKLAIPPQTNVEKPEWDRDSTTTDVATETESEIYDDGLDDIRKKLEGLL